jgi:solute carrier family 44 (choline transporter-like protein), member 1
MTRNAYIVIAKDGTPLIQSGKKAFHLLKAHSKDVIALNFAGDFVMFIAKVFVVAITGFVGYEVLKPSTSDLKYGLVVPLVISIVFAFMIVHCIMTVLEMTIDTIFICFCDDCEENNGTDRPYLMSPGLMKIMQDLNKPTGSELLLGGDNLEAGSYPMGQEFYN